MLGLALHIGLGLGSEGTNECGAQLCLPDPFMTVGWACLNRDIDTKVNQEESWKDQKE